MLLLYRDHCQNVLLSQDALLLLVGITDEQNSKQQDERSFEGLKVNFLSALDSFPLFNFTVSPGEKMCFTGCFSVDTTI